MKRIWAVLAAIGLANGAQATPTTMVWTPCSIDMQAYGVVHLTYDNYTTLGRKGPGRSGSAFANDLGLTVGVLPFERWQMEIGADWMEPADDPLYFNAKFGAPEGVLFKGAPALEAGIFNVGTRKGVTDQNVGDIVTGRSLPAGLGRIHIGGYWGNARVLRSSAGVKANAGVMAAYDIGFLPAAEGGFNRIVIGADWMSGRNAIGGGALAVNYCFAKNASILAGPVWFNDAGINGAWKWTTQFDGNF
jgi:hypothetical protein